MSVPTPILQKLPLQILVYTFYTFVKKVEKIVLAEVMDNGLLVSVGVVVCLFISVSKNL